MKSMYRAPGKMYMVRPGIPLKDGTPTFQYGYFKSNTSKWVRISNKAYLSWDEAQDDLDNYADRRSLIWRGTQKN